MGPAHRARVPDPAAPDVRLPARRRHRRARRLHRVPVPRHARRDHGVRAREHHDLRGAGRAARRDRPVPVAADVPHRRAAGPGDRGHARQRRRPRGAAGRRPGDRVADPRGHRQRAGRGGAAAAPAVRVPLGRDLPRAAVPRAGRRDGGPDPGVAVRLPVERVRADLDNARLAAGDLGVEPGDGHRRRDARAVRQPDRGGDRVGAENAVLLAVVWPVVLSVVFATLAVRRWARLGR